MIPFSSRALLISQLPKPSVSVMAPHRLLAIENARITAKEWGVYRSAAHFDETSSMSLFLYPYAPVERVEVAVLFNTIGFFLDDGLGHDKHYGSIVANRGEFVSWLSKALSNPRELQINAVDPMASHLLRVAFKLLNRVYEMSNGDYTRRFRDSTLEHWQESFSLEDKYTSIENFILIRRRMGGMYAMMEMIEFCYDRYLPDDLRHHPLMEQALEYLADIGGLSNELFSYPKEVIEQGAKLNFVSVIQHVRDCELEQALQEAIAYINQATRDFNASCQELLAAAKESRLPGSEMVEWYVGAMRDVAWASYAWQMYTERYNHEEHLFTEKRYERRFKESDELV